MAPEPQRYSPDPTLTPEQHHILALLAEGRSLTEAAAEVGIHRNTVRNWRRTVPAFARECEFAIQEQALVWHEHALQLAPRAAAVLNEILHDPAVSPALRLRAALAVLKMAANPQPKALPALHSFSAEIEALRGERLASQGEALPSKHPALFEPAVHEENSESCTILHNPTLRPILHKALEPGRNTPCPCGSGQKFKRCCAPYAPPRNAPPHNALPRTASTAAA